MYRPRRGLGACVIDDEGVERCDAPAIPLCSSLPAVPSTFVGPFNCVGAQSDVPRYDASGTPATQGALDAIWSYVLAINPGAPGSPPAGSFTEWVNRNAKVIGLGAVGVIGLLWVARR